MSNIRICVECRHSGMCGMQTFGYVWNADSLVCMRGLQVSGSMNCMLRKVASSAVWHAARDGLGGNELSRYSQCKNPSGGDSPRVRPLGSDTASWWLLSVSLPVTLATTHSRWLLSVLLPVTAPSPKIDETSRRLLPKGGKNGLGGGEASEEYCSYRMASLA